MLTGFPFNPESKRLLGFGAPATREVYPKRIGPGLSWRAPPPDRHPRSESMASPYLQAALEASETAAAVIRKAYRRNFSVQYKADASPVTEVDIAAEAAIKAVLKRHFPDHGFYGEELGREAGDGQHLWLIDPIDGTKSFVRGYPMFSTQIALMRGGELILGLSSAPSWNGGLGETVTAELGEGAWLDDQQLRVSATDTIEKTTLSTGNLARLARSPAWSRLGGLIPRLHRIRGYGDFLHYHLLAGGKIDAVVESDVNILDIAALSVIVREAGGVFTDLEGQPLSLETTSVLASAPGLHAPLLDALRYEPPAWGSPGPRVGFVPRPGFGVGVDAVGQPAAGAGRIGLLRQQEHIAVRAAGAVDDFDALDRHVAFELEHFQRRRAVVQQVRIAGADHLREMLQRAGFGAVAGRGEREHDREAGIARRLVDMLQRLELDAHDGRRIERGIGLRRGRGLRACGERGAECEQAEQDQRAARQRLGPAHQVHGSSPLE
ncbi:MAG: hypothetical protein NVS9B10_01710 [Nevskia sp.]